MKLTEQLEKLEAECIGTHADMDSEDGYIDVVGMKDFEKLRQVAIVLSDSLATYSDSGGLNMAGRSIAEARRILGGADE